MHENDICLGKRKTHYYEVIVSIVRNVSLAGTSDGGGGW